MKVNGDVHAIKEQMLVTDGTQHIPCVFVIRNLTENFRLK